jgi:predicted Zn-dependent protease with MMP-like domain
MDREKFENLVIQAIGRLPEELKNKMANVDVVVSDNPSRSQLAKTGTGSRHTLFGLYEGVPQTRRGLGYGLVPPDKITIFQKPIEAAYRSEPEIAAAIARVVKHELAHHFGLSDARLRQIEDDER